MGCALDLMIVILQVEGVAIGAAGYKTAFSEEQTGRGEANIYRRGSKEKQ